MAKGQGNCFEIRFSTEDAQVGDTIEVLTTVRGFVEIVSYQFVAQWNPAELQYVKYSASGAALAGQLFGASSAAQGIFRALWSDINATGVTAPNDALLFKMYFKVLADTIGFCPIKIKPDDILTIYEVANNNSNKFPLSNVIGGARVNKSSDFVLDDLCVIPPPCTGNAGNLQASVSGGVPPYQYHWTGPNGFASADSLLNALTPGRYDLRVTDAVGNEVQAITRFFSGGAAVYGSVTVQASKCQLANGCAQVNAYSGTPPYSYSWSQPGSVNLSRCDLFSGTHSVTISDAKGCIAVQDFEIEKDTLLEVELTPSFADCRFDLLGGVILSTDGAPPFSYHWSNGSTAANLEQTHPGAYAVSVTDAEGCAGSASTLIKDYGTFDWKFSLGNYCDPDTTLGRIDLYGYALAQRTTPPLSIAWDNGTRQEIHDLDETLVYQLMSRFQEVPNGLYTVTITDADGCSQVETIASKCYKNITLDTLSPQFYIESNTANGNIEVRGKGLKGIKSLAFSLNWQANDMDLDELIWQGSFLSGVSFSNFTTYPSSGRIDFSWTSPSPQGHYGDTDIRLFRLRFADNQYDHPSVNFGEFTNAPYQVEHVTEGKKPFIGRCGAAHFAYPSGGYDEIPEFNLTAPSCAYDGYRSIQLNSSDPDVNPYSQKIYGSFNYTTPVISSDDLLFAKPGILNIRAAGAGRFYINIPPYSLPASECVWPGDADNNSVVNHFDLLYLGLGMNSQSAPRAESANLWRGCDAQDWLESSPTRHINFKNLDLDGNGLIETADTTTLLRHWGQMINPFAAMQPYRMPYAPDTFDTARKVSIQADTVSTGVEVKIPLSFAADGIQGLAFSVSYDSVLVVSDAKFEPLSSWMGDPLSDLICVQKDFQNQSRLDIAITRTDGQASSGAGAIGYLVLTFKTLPPDSWLRTVLFTAHALAMTPAEKLIALGETRQEIILRSPVNNATQTSILPDNTIVLSPNPASENLLLQSNSLPVRRIEISSADGSLHQILDFAMAAQQVQIELGKMPAGTYFARVFCETGVVVKKFMIVRTY